MTFRVYPEKWGGVYFQVILFKTRRAMHKYYVATGDDLDKNFVAVVRSWERLDVKGKTQRDLGDILFCDSIIGGGTVAHEMVHAGMSWAARRKIDVWTHKGEEQLAVAVERMTRQFWNRWHGAQGKIEVEMEEG